MLEGHARDGSLLAPAHVERADPTQVHKGLVRDGRLVAAKRLNPAQVHQGCIRDDRLVAAFHIELQVHKSRVSDGRLIAARHVEPLDPAQVHEGRVCYTAALPRVHSAVKHRRQSALTILFYELSERAGLKVKRL